MFATTLIKFIVENPWRTAALALALTCGGLVTAMRFQTLRLDRAVFAREQAEAVIAQHVTAGIVQDRKIAAVADELTALRKRQIADTKRIQKLLASWPVDCDGAVTAAAGILRGRE